MDKPSFDYRDLTGGANAMLHDPLRRPEVILTGEDALSAMTQGGMARGYPDLVDVVAYVLQQVVEDHRTNRASLHSPATALSKMREYLDRLDVELLTKE